MQGKHITEDTKSAERKLLENGLHYKEISKQLGVSYEGLLKRNLTEYKINCIEAFRNRIKDNYPNRLSITDAFGYWFSGWIDGEGHFGLHNYERKSGIIGQNLLFQVKIRDDDYQVIDMVKKSLQVGNITRRVKNGKTFSNPTITYKICNVKDLAEVIVPLFNKYQLYTKKKDEFSIWREAVIERYILTMGGVAKIKGNGVALNSFGYKIKDVRKYKEISCMS